MQGNQIAKKKMKPILTRILIPQKRSYRYLHGTGVTKKQGHKKLMLFLYNRQNSSCSVNQKVNKKKKTIIII